MSFAKRNELAGSASLSVPMLLDIVRSIQSAKTLEDALQPAGRAERILKTLLGKAEQAAEEALRSEVED